MIIPKDFVQIPILALLYANKRESTATLKEDSNSSLRIPAVEYFLPRDRDSNTYSLNSISQ